MFRLTVVALLFALVASCAAVTTYTVGTTNGIQAANNVNPGVGCNGNGTLPNNPAYSATLANAEFDVYASPNDAVLRYTLSWTSTGSSATAYNATQIHIHEGNSTTNGNVVATICNSLTTCSDLNAMAQTLNVTTGGIDVTKDYYLNIHSANCPSGIARGQLTFAQVTNTPTAAPTGGTTASPTGATTAAPTSGAVRTGVSVALALAALIAALLF
mmetsp:Transcript_62231/g.86546  ORF Transcript_62231/g.86546 Transcript_62231/m.86546 type:complete len:215 (-) Transcript_62231:150-794(-)